ncbi:tetratricopeptide repeat protein [Mucilaginibacter sp. RS28]|uniref:Tetratricopeptide repeat protein n=1 Tax=Mucilaginibacter straminoryzae TaxID=2932774 RepID=A0A9X1X6T0_9SPHI|nr:tetratricopeptide repeat protein [Mucilaginibacter straminoryzae]MCJ8211415.1 tetratricopeptide repeat protein [Mucilaginibacter straminoryzae]
MKKILLFTLIYLSGIVIASAQTEKDKARQKGEEAVKLEDEGKFDQALVLLAEAIKLDPDNISFPYETAYSYYAQKQYSKAIEVLNKLKDHKDCFDRVYQLLGNAYDLSGQNQMAITTYNDGLKRFPQSGSLYLESGNIYLVKKEYDKALNLYEQGIMAEPSFASNYYWASRIYCGSDEKFWGMIYGEIFINLERNSQRTREISKLLYETYKSQITFSGKDSVKVSFSKSNVINYTGKGPIKFPYNVIYEPTMAMAVAGQKEINLASLNTIRANFIKFYYQREFNKTYPNALFEYNKKLQDNGFDEAYNYWIFSAADPQAFESWRNSNQEKWQKFIAWFGPNPLKLSPENRFYRTQYN